MGNFPARAHLEACISSYLTLFISPIVILPLATLTVLVASSSMR